MENRIFHSHFRFIYLNFSGDYLLEKSPPPPHPHKLTSLEEKNEKKKKDKQKQNSNWEESVVIWLTKAKEKVV